MSGSDIVLNAHRLIYSWFRKHDGDGEFLCLVRALPYSVIACRNYNRGVIYTTKPDVIVSLLGASPALYGFGMIGRYGLPDVTDLVWIRRFVGQRQIFFLGDMDPVDLLILAWLNASFPRKRITQLGINDGLLDLLGIRSTEPLSIQCSESELKSRALLKRVIPGLSKLIGPKCAAKLEQGMKLETEILLGNKRRAAAKLKSLLLARK